jgi:hypothetical protein
MARFVTGVSPSYTSPFPLCGEITHLNLVVSTTANTDVSGVVTVLIGNTSAVYTFFAGADAAGHYSNPPRCVVSPNLSPTASGVGSFWAVTTTSSLTIHTNVAVTTANLPFTYICTVTTI